MEWVEDVFILNHLPGRIFVFGPSEHMSNVRNMALIRSQPIPIPRGEWCGQSSPLFFPPHIDQGTWVRITQRRFPYSGDLAYVVGSALKSDVLLIAIVPRIRRPGQEEMREKMDKMDKEEGAGTCKQKGKKRTFRRKDPKLPPALFDPDAMLVRFGPTAVKVFTVEDVDPIKNFAGKFVTREVTVDPDTNKRVETAVNLDLFRLGKIRWAVTPAIGESIHQFDGHVFYRGLLILPIYSYGTVERVIIPPIDELVPFAESGIDPVRINHLLSQLHWQIGDRVVHADGLFELQDIQVDIGSASVCPAEKTSPATASMAQLLPLNSLQRKFSVNDGVLIVAGVHKGLTGSVLRDDGGILHVLTDKDGSYVSIV